jgi:hypothetical protein
MFLGSFESDNPPQVEPVLHPIRILVLWRPFSRSSFDGCTNFLVAFPLPLLLSLLLLAVFDKKVESNVTAASDETLRL